MSNDSTLPESPRREPDGRVGRATLHLILGGLLVAGVVGAVGVHHRVASTGTGGISVADQEAVEADVPHTVVGFGGALLGAGKSWSSSSTRGHLLVVNYWASWCGPCRAEQPGLGAVARGLQSRGVRFVGVNIQDQQVSALAYVREFRVPYPSLFDQGSLTAATLKVFALPTTFILDRDGRVAYRLTGKTTEQTLTTRLEKLLAQGSRWAP